MGKQNYAETNKQWLAERAKEEGIHTLSKGVLYKVLSSHKGEDKHPTPRSIVTVHYSGRTINGKVFDSSKGGVAPAMRLSDLIEGWIIALQHMSVGDKWEIYIPAELGYGRYPQPGIPSHSTLIFEIELLAIA